MNENSTEGCLLCILCLLIGMFIGGLMAASSKNGQIQQLQRAHKIDIELIGAYEQYRNAPSTNMASKWGHKIDSLNIVRKVKDL